VCASNEDVRAGADRSCSRKAGSYAVTFARGFCAGPTKEIAGHPATLNGQTCAITLDQSYSLHEIETQPLGS